MQSINGYTLTELLGKGTYGEVFKASKIGSTAVLAVKRISKKSLSSRAVDNLIDEITILKGMSHRNITQMIDFTWDTNFVYLFVEYLPGGDLSQFIRSRKRLAEKVIRYFLQQLAFALHYLFSKNIVHMDIKPQNILLTSSSPPTLKLTDFGFAQSIKGTVQMGEIRGSLLYMAPEIYCHGIYDKSCDLWSVGVILFECLFGRAPFASTTLEELQSKLANKSPINIPSSPPISDDCSNLLTRLLQREPANRIHHEEFFIHQFIDLSHAPSPDSLLKAVTFLEKAEDLNSSGNSVDAYLNYREGLLNLASAAQYEQDPTRKTLLRQKLSEYITVAENLKNTIQLGTSSAITPCAKYENVANIPITPRTIPSVGATDASNKVGSAVGRLKRAGLIFSWLGSTSSQPVDGTEVNNQHDYSIRRLDTLDELVELRTSGLAKVVKNLKKFYNLLLRNEFQSALDYLENGFSSWLDVVRADTCRERQVEFRRELKNALECAEKLKENLVNKVNLDSLADSVESEKGFCGIS